MKFKFEPGNDLGTGRPKYSRNWITKKQIQVFIDHASEPVKGRNGETTKLREALETLWRQRPETYVAMQAKVATALAPKELLVGAADPVVEELSDEQLADVIATLRSQPDEPAVH